MTDEKMQELIEYGFNEEWLKNIKDNFKPEEEGKYQIAIYDCDTLDQEPDTGFFLFAFYFSNERDLSYIHRFFEGMFYTMKVVETDEELGRGIIDGSPFDEMAEHEGTHWHWLMGRDLDFALAKNGGSSDIQENEEFLKNLIDEKVNEIFFEYQTRAGIENGDISPIDALKLDEIQQQLEHLIRSVCNKN